MALRPRPPLDIGPRPVDNRLVDEHKGRPVAGFASQQAWAEWLAEHYAGSRGLWLRIAKKGSGIATVSYAEALETALCWGWIDGQKAKLDDDHWLQLFTPRGPRSKWSKINREKAEALLAKGAIQPAGRAQIERARAEGRWEAAYDSHRTATVPDDLRIALEKNRKAREFFATLDSANRYAILYRIAEAKRPETRARRVEKYVAMLAQHEKLHP
jgi:uncharacterized protein YdeI (YjbR/CyaY-like superfamily)